MMSSLAKNMKTLAAVVGFAAAGIATGAQAQTTKCGVVGYSLGATTIDYDPFGKTGLINADITMQLERVNNSGGGDTRIVNFYLRANSTVGAKADGISVIPTSVSGNALIEGAGDRPPLSGPR